MDRYDYSPFIDFLEQRIRPEWAKNERSASTTNELLQPGMFYTSLISFLLTPAKAKKMILDRKSETGNGMRDFINDVFDEIGAWLYENRVHLRTLETVASGFTVIDVDDGVILDGFESITPEAESKFIGEHDDIALIKLKVKLLAAIDVQFTAKQLTVAYSKENTLAFSEYAFLLFRSMLQFSSYSAMIDGFVFQYKRMFWAAQEKDRKGLEAIIIKMTREHSIPINAARKIWNKIRVEAISRGSISLNNDYTIDYREHPTDSGIYEGEIVQTNPDGEDYPIKFEAFKSFLRDRIKRGVIA